MMSCVARQVGLADHLASVIDAKRDVEYSASQGAKVNWSPVSPEHRLNWTQCAISRRANDFAAGVKTNHCGEGVNAASDGASRR